MVRSPLGGLALGVLLDLTVLRRHLDALFDLGPKALGGLALFYSVMIYGFFMGMPVFNLLVGVIGGYLVGRKAALHGLSADRANRMARVTAMVATSILAVLCVATAWMALHEPTIGSQMRGMLGLPFEVTTPMIYATIGVGGAALRGGVVGLLAAGLVASDFLTSDGEVTPNRLLVTSASLLVLPDLQDLQFVA